MLYVVGRRTPMRWKRLHQYHGVIENPTVRCDPQEVKSGRYTLPLRFMEAKKFVYLQ